MLVDCVKKYSVLHQLLALGKSSLEWKAQNKYTYMQFKQTILIAIKHWSNMLNANNFLKNKMDLSGRKNFPDIFLSENQGTRRQQQGYRVGGRSHCSHVWGVGALSSSWQELAAKNEEWKKSMGAGVAFQPASKVQLHTKYQFWENSSN